MITLAIEFCVWGIMLVMCLTLYRLLMGPTAFDRALAANSFTTKTTLLLLTLGSASGKMEFYVDIALLYAIIGFIANIALVRLHTVDHALVSLFWEKPFRIKNTKEIFSQTEKPLPKKDLH